MVSIREIEAPEIPVFSGMIPDIYKREYLEGTEYRFFGIYKDKAPAGIVVLRYEGLNLIIEWMAVSLESRGRGIGKEAFARIIEYSYEENRREVVIMFVPGRYPWLDDRILEYGFDTEETMRSSVDVVLSDLLSHRSEKESYNDIVPLSSLNHMQLRTLGALCSSYGEDIIGVPIDPLSFLSDLSAVHLSSEGRNSAPDGALFVRRFPGGEGVEVPWLFCKNGDPIATLHLITWSIRGASKVLPGNTRVRFLAANEKVTLFSRKLTGKEPVRLCRASFCTGSLDAF